MLPQRQEDQAERTQRKPRLPRGAVGRVAGARRDAVAVAVRAVAQVRAAPHHPGVTRRGPRRVASGGPPRGRCSTSRRTTPRRCPPCCTGRSRSARRRRPGRCPRSRPRRCSSWGSAPARCCSGARRPGSARRPTGSGACSSPPRAAYSHSASVGSRLPAQAAVGARASFQETCDDGMVAAPSQIRLPGPRARRQSAPLTATHHGRRRPDAASRAAAAGAGTRRRRRTSRNARPR